MKVALESGEVLEVALLEGDRVVGTLSLQLKGLSSGSRAGRPAGSSASASSAAPGGRKTRKPRKPMSSEAKARMAAAQKLRWENKRAKEAGSNQ